ncbi:hypothetical protein PARPLA_01486 [Rhodobacteraceae bacterium THAF1]|uniref:DUF484 family protein n=1 Tax=Palleronia sp. THAF1 TaxID=2587842 RepID=UPI000F3B0CED|nr:DUF484 family protein [Palleronia sp. THAF1]QFU07605.1 hypothetical protein FIU81_02825 [Palleronia sp. THAF1]VDC22823.1 hypothetical protein PARPLA_01486 [Rhodobacteraceae bacterium THAF1]
MSTHPLADARVRDSLLSDPDRILDDTELMHAIALAADGGRGENVVDMRGIAMERLEARLDRLEDTHRNVIAAAYENLAGTNMIHRAVLGLLEHDTFEGFVNSLRGPVADTLRVDGIKLVLETAGDRSTAHLGTLKEVLGLAEAGYVSLFAGLAKGGQPRKVTLRQIACGNPDIYGDVTACAIRSEACLTLDLGEGRLPGMLILGAEDPHQFGPGQGTDLLAFFAAVLERTLRRFLA